MKIKIAIALYVVGILILIPLAIQGIYKGDTRTFALSLVALILGFVAVTGFANYNKRNRSDKK